MNELLTALALWLADFFLLATALLLVATLALWRLKQPAQRMALAWATMAGLTALIVATAAPTWPRWDLQQWFSAAPLDETEPLLEPVVTYTEKVVPLFDEPRELPAIGGPAPVPRPVEPVPSAARNVHWPTLGALAWLSVAAAALGWIALGAVQARRLLWTARPSPLWAQTELARLIGRHKKPRLKTSSRIGSAVALGTLKPAILLPAENVREDNRAGVQAALAHEWAHIRHGDLWLLAWQRLLLPILAAHPLFWLLRRQIRADQELLADLAAAGERPVEYAEALLAWAKEAGRRPGAGLAALAMWENPQTVSRRIQMILDPQNPVARKGSRLGKWLIVAGVATVVGGLSLVSLRSQSVVAQEEDQIQNPRTIDSAEPLPATAQVQQIELAVSMIRLGKGGEEITTESLRELGQPFGDNDSFAWDNGVCVVALPREQVATAIKLLRESGDAKILMEPKLMTLSGRDAYVADGGQLPSIRETDFADGRRIEQIEHKALRSLRIRPEIRTQSASLPAESKAASIIRLSVTREHIEPIDELDPNSETEKTRPRLITRQLKFTADVPIGRTLLVWELKPVAEDEANLVLITPEGIHAVTRQVFANPQPPLDDAASNTPRAPESPEVFIWPNDPAAVKQIKAALEKLRQEAATNDKLREELHKKTERLQKQVLDLTARLQWLSANAKPDAGKKISDAEFLRRVYLDLLGALPSADDVKSFVDSRDDNKRQKLIDKLLEDPKVPDHWAKTWSELIVVVGDRSAKTSPKTPLPSPTASKLVRAFTLQNLPAEKAVVLVKELFQSDDKSPLRVAADARSNSVIVHGSQQEIDTLTAILKVMDQHSEADSAERRAPETLAPRPAGHDLKTQRRLLEIDLQQAEAEMELAAAELAETKKLGPGTVSAAELRRKEAEFHQARLKRERAKVLLESAIEQEKSAARSPLDAVEEAVVPPKNLAERIWETLGLKLEPIDEDAFEGLKSAFRGGLMVNDVRPNSPADERGLRQGDILVGLSRWETSSLDNVAYILARDDAREGREITFHILRDGKAMVGRLSWDESGATRPPTPARPAIPATPAAPGPSRRLSTQIRLAEIDLREAQLKLEAISKKQARLEELSKQNSASPSDVDQVNLERQLAILAVEEAQIVLDGLKSQTAKPASE